jgi:hypothetical protein
MSYAEYLKKATALKRQGDMAGAIEAIDQALDLCSPGDSGAPQALKKKIAYLIAADRKQEALVSAEVLVGRAEEGAMGMEQLVGAHCSIALQERVKAKAALGDSVGAFSDHVRAVWWWQQAMCLQGRVKEHSPVRAASRLVEIVATLNGDMSQASIRAATAEGLTMGDAEQMVALFDLPPGGGQVARWSRVTFRRGCQIATGGRADLQRRLGDT